MLIPAGRAGLWNWRHCCLLLLSRDVQPQLRHQAAFGELSPAPRSVSAAVFMVSLVFEGSSGLLSGLVSHEIMWQKVAEVFGAVSFRTSGTCSGLEHMGQ